MSPVAVFVLALESAFALGGAVLLWRLVLSPTARAQRPAPALPPWRPTPVEVFTFLAFVLGGALVITAVGSTLVRALGARGDNATVLTGACAQLGLLTGVLLFRYVVRMPSVPSPARSSILTSGAVTFLVSLPLLMLTAKVSEVLLRLTGLPTERQDLVGIFAGAESPLMMVVMITLAVVIAPLTEELVFRAGLFRIMRGLVPRWFAVIGPAVFFAALHVNWLTGHGLASFAPLALLAVVFSLAYERTGQIGTPIVAHALFNLNTVMLIYSGVGDV
jgi:uncharacterized protein